MIFSFQKIKLIIIKMKQTNLFLYTKLFLFLMVTLFFILHKSILTMQCTFITFRYLHGDFTAFFCEAIWTVENCLANCWIKAAWSMPFATFESSSSFPHISWFFFLLWIKFVSFSLYFSIENSENNSSLLLYCTN